MPSCSGFIGQEKVNSTRCHSAISFSVDGQLWL